MLEFGGVDIKTAPAMVSLRVQSAQRAIECWKMPRNKLSRESKCIATVYISLTKEGAFQ